MKRLALLALLAVPLAAQADVSFGGSRSPGMAGAGLALRHDTRGPGWRNPALYALNNNRFRVQAPELRYAFNGFGYSDLEEFFDFDLNNPLEEDLGRLARAFGDGSTDFGAYLGMGAQIGPVGIDVKGEAAGATIPNAPLRNWVDQGANLVNVPADAQLDGYGLGMVEVGLSSGVRLPTPDGSLLAVGGRLKYLEGYYSHLVAGQQQIQNGGSVISAELGGENYLRESGIGLDVGAYYEPSYAPGWSGAMLITNFVEPGISFQALDPGINNGFSTVSAGPRMIDMGVAFDRGPWILAVDAVDIFDSNNQQDLRVGGEIHAGKALAIRGGFSTRTGFVAGAGIGGFNFAFSERLPIAAGYSIRF